MKMQDVVIQVIFVCGIFDGNYEVSNLFDFRVDEIVQILDGSILVQYFFVSFQDFVNVLREFRSQGILIYV